MIFFLAVCINCELAHSASSNFGVLLLIFTDKRPNIDTEGLRQTYYKAGIF